MAKRFPCPICEHCGGAFYEGLSLDNNEIYNADKIKMRYPVFTPRRCPHCHGRIIEVRTDQNGIHVIVEEEKKMSKSAVSKMKEVPGLFGLKLDEPFKLKMHGTRDEAVIYEACFHERGLDIMRAVPSTRIYHDVCTGVLHDMLTGELEVIYSPFTPAHNERFYAINANGKVFEQYYNEGCVTPMMLVLVGNCYPSAERATLDKDLWVKRLTSKEWSVSFND